MAETMTWIALGYRLSALPSRNRVYVWRRLKDFGAVYFESGVALLPMREDVICRLEELRADILRFGGRATLASMRFLRREDDQALVDRFNEAVRVEYGEVERIFRRLVDTVRAAREDGSSLSCGESLTASFRHAARLRGKIRERDYFDSPAGKAAEAIYREASASVEEYLAALPAGERRRSSRSAAGL